MASGVEVLKRTANGLDLLLRDLPVQWTMNSDGEDSWSPYQVVGHMTYLDEFEWMDRVVVILDGDPASEFRPVDREAGFSLYHQWPLEQILDHFVITRQTNLTQLESLVSENDLGRECRHPDFGVVSLSQLLATWVAHDLNHWDQIVKTMAKNYRHAVGPWREYLPIIDAQ